MLITGNNLSCSYTLLDSKLTVTIQGEKNLGDIASSLVKTSAHCTAEVKKANTTRWYTNNGLENSMGHGII